MQRAENVHVVLEDCFLPSTGSIMRSITHELDQIYGPAENRVSCCPPTAREKEKGFEETISLVSEKAQGAVRADGMAVYVMPTSVSYNVGTQPHMCGILISVAAVKDGPVGVFIDFCDGSSTPLELIEIISRQANDLYRTVMRDRRVPGRIADQSEVLIEAVRVGFSHARRFHN